MNTIRTLAIGMVILGIVALFHGCRDETATTPPEAGKGAEKPAEAAQPVPANLAADSQPRRSAADEPAPANPGPVWHRSLEDALAEAASRNSLVVVDAYADWCHWCKMLDKNTLSSKKVLAELKSFALCKLNTDKNPALARRFGVEGLPTTLVLDKTGKVIASRSGYLPPDAYIAFLKQAAKAARM